MKKIQVKLNINPSIYLKDPTSTTLGKNIIENSVLLIDELGLDDFSFRKLAIKIGSTESSIYRYFENKHYLFIYLLNWYWEWTSTRMDLALMNLTDSNKKLETIIKLLIEASFVNADAPFVNEEVLHRIVVREGTKAYHHKLVDTENTYGFFLSYKALCKKISLVILEMNPDHKYPKALASTMVETANNHIYFAKHLPRLSDIEESEDMEKIGVELYNILYHLTLSSINGYNNQVNTTKPLRSYGRKIEL